MVHSKLGKNFADYYDRTQFDILLLEGMTLVELDEDDKAFLEQFNATKILNLSYTGLRNLKNLPVMSSLE